MAYDRLRSAGPMAKSRAARAERTGQCATSTPSTRSAMPWLGSSASRTTVLPRSSRCRRSSPATWRQSSSRARTASASWSMRSWGFILLRDGYAPKRVTNTRDDKAYTQVLEGQLREAALPGAGDGLLRAGRGQASELALVRAEGRRGAPAVRVPRHLPAVEGPDQEGWPQRRHRGLQLHDDAAERADRDHQSRDGRR